MLIGQLNKESADISRVTIDAENWIDTGETLMSYTPPVITQIISQYPGPLPYFPLAPQVPIGPAPADTNPLVFASQFLLSSAIELFIGRGTTGLAYQVQTTILGTSTRKITVEFYVFIIPAPGIGYANISA